ncbi:hypothetical protein [Streptomyces sp. NPDC058157]|uniref:hypothetical protein n=1 Tax=Streptomyces sp. NPDC058157 TaxID=3346360 RepID=UPI0036E0C5AA
MCHPAWARARIAALSPAEAPGPVAGEDASPPEAEDEPRTPAGHRPPAPAVAGRTGDR